LQINRIQEVVRNKQGISIYGPSRKTGFRVHRQPGKIKNRNIQRVAPSGKIFKSRSWS
jgi:hypothetical protein